MKPIVRLSIVVFALILAANTDVSACSCPSVPATVEVKLKFKFADAVFSGTVVEITDKPGTPDIIARIAVEEVWKGPVTKEIFVSTHRHEGSCGYPFKVGKSYLVYGRQNGGSELTTGLCLRNAPIERASEELKALGRGKSPIIKKSSARQ